MRYRLSFSAALAVLALSIWLSSGTMSPYAITLDKPRVLEPCGYLANIDHPHFVATYLMLDGAPSEQWAFSVVLRRIAFPIFAYPFMKIAGFDAGGFMASVILNLAAFVGFTCFVRRRYGDGAGAITAWVLATYPGISYWAGLPYAYATIVPSCLLGAILLTELERADGWRRVLALSLGVGLLGLAYDLLPYFGAASALILCFRRDLNGRIKALMVLTVGALLPAAIGNLILGRIFHLTFENSNTTPYYQIVGAYYHAIATVFHLPDWRPAPLLPPPIGAETVGLSWTQLVEQFPRFLLQNYLFSNFLFLPLFMLALWGLLAWRRQLRFSMAEGCLLTAIAAGFLFNNLAPPYGGWQLRGTWMPRLYQPLIAVFMLFLARNAAMLVTGMGQRLNRGFISLVAMLCLANASIAFGPILHNPLAGQMYYRFYKHAVSATAFTRNLDRYGRRPMGFCRSLRDGR
jgi:hypothetical protein